MRTRGRLGGALLALLLGLAGAGVAVSASGTAAGAAHRAVRVAESLPRLASALGHAPHPAVGKPHLHPPAMPAASTGPAGVGLTALVALAAAAAVVTRGGRRSLLPAAIRAPPCRQ